MKLFKLTKSLDYASYPSYKELVKISNAVSNTMATFQNMLISAIVGILFDRMPLSDCILTYIISKKFANAISTDSPEYKNCKIALAVIIAVTVFALIKLIYFIISRLGGKNKNTKKKRDILVYEFYNVAIPQLIEVKSIMEQVKEDKSGEIRKKALLLLQAKHDMFDLHDRVYNMNIIEKNRQKKQTKASKTLSRRISRCAYIKFLEEMLDIMCMIYVELSASCSKCAKEDIDDIRSMINSSGVFDKVETLVPKLQEIRGNINSSN